MTRIPLDERFFATTRGQLVLLLRRGPRTAGDLARTLGLTSSVARGHLATLERDGVVRPQGAQRGPRGKRARLYALTPEVEELFPKAYARVLRQILDVLRERLPPSEVDTVLREAGRRIAVEEGHASSPDLSTRLAFALAVFKELGGLADLEEEDGRLYIAAFSCPLIAVVPRHPELCRMTEALLGEVIGVRVSECCNRSEPPRCRFEVGSAPSTEHRSDHERPAPGQ